VHMAVCQSLLNWLCPSLLEAVHVAVCPSLLEAVHVVTCPSLLEAVHVVTCLKECMFMIEGGTKNMIWPFFGETLILKLCCEN